MRMRTLAIFSCAMLALGACSGDDDASEVTAGTVSSTVGAPPSTEPPIPISVLVTNDDGVTAEGIDVLVLALEKISGVTVTVVAPAENKSGSGGQTTPGPLTVSAAQTASGRAAVAVQGFPADTIVWAIDQGGVPERPDLVVSGINFGQNIGTFVDISGTVGAARAAAARGLPALAVSQGLGDQVDYSVAALTAVAWIVEHRTALTADTVASINVPTCTTGSLRDVVEVPVAGPGTDALAPVDCTSTLTDPATDVEAFTNGYITQSQLSVVP